jgi:hypothetical protein
MAGRSRAKRGASVLQVSYFYDGEFYGTECFSQRRIVIGRGPEADINIQCDLISRVHAVLRIIGDKMVVEDLGSLNGICSLGAYTLKFHLLSFGSYQPVSQLEVLDLSSAPDWEDTSEATALPMLLEAEPTIDFPRHLHPPVEEAIEPEDFYILEDSNPGKLFPMADLLEPDPNESGVELVSQCPLTRPYPMPAAPRERIDQELPLARQVTRRTTTKVTRAPFRRYTGARKNWIEEDDCILLVG